MKKGWAFITGISSGVGKCVAIRLSQEDLNVIGVSRRRPPYLSDFPNINWFGFDLSKPFDANGFTAGIRRYTENLQLIVVNAAFGHFGKFQTILPEHIDRFVHTNFISTICMLQQVDKFLTDKGQVIFVGSAAEYFPAPQHALYGSLKAAQSHLAMSLNLEYQKKGVKFKVIKPCAIRTSFGKKSGSPDWSSESWFHIEPERVANDILKLTKRNRLVAHSGTMSKIMYLLNRLSPRMCFELSKKKHRF